MRFNRDMRFLVVMPLVLAILGIVLAVGLGYIQRAQNRRRLEQARREAKVYTHRANRAIAEHTEKTGESPSSLEPFGIPRRVVLPDSQYVLSIQYSKTSNGYTLHTSIAPPTATNIISRMESMPLKLGEKQSGDAQQQFQRVP